MESSDDYTESPAGASAKSPDKDGQRVDGYTYFLNKQRAAKGLPPVKDEESDLADSDDDNSGRNAGHKKDEKDGKLDTAKLQAEIRARQALRE